jgi:hypothetical protein
MDRCNDRDFVDGGGSREEKGNLLMVEVARKRKGGFVSIWLNSSNATRNIADRRSTIDDHMMMSLLFFDNHHQRERLVCSAYSSSIIALRGQHMGTRHNFVSFCGVDEQMYSRP